MRFGVPFWVCASLAATSLSNAAEFSQTRDLPPLKMAARDLDAILIKAHSVIDAANGPPGQESSREGVKLGVTGYEIQIPHFSLASSVAFPNELFAFCYTYHQSDKPISSVTIDLGDSSRRISVSGESADQVEAVSKLVEKDLLPHSTVIGGARFRRVAGAFLLVALFMSLMVSSVYCWKTRSYSALGMPICSGLGLLLVLLVPWDRYLPGFALYQSYSPFLLVKYAAPIFFLSLIATILGIPLSYFLPRWREKA
jgi:hypothetical protein